MAQPELPYWRLSSFYFFYFALLGATAPFLPLYLDYLEFSPERIGELVAIPMLMRCLAPNLWGWLGDKTGQRLRIVRVGAACTLVFFSLIFFRQDYYGLALVMLGHAFFWHAILPQFEVITFSHLGTDTARYSSLRLWGSVGFLLFVIVFGYVFAGVGLGIYPLTVVSVMLGIFLSSLLVPEPPKMQSNEARHPARSSFKAFLRELQQPKYLAFYGLIGLMQLSHGPYYTFLTLYLEQLNYPRAWAGWFWSLGVLAEIGIFMLMPRLLSRFNLSQVLVASLAIAAVRWLILGTAAEYLVWLLVAQLMHAATFGSFHVAAIQFIQKNMPAAFQGQAQAFYVSASGAGAALGALYAGYSWSSLGPTVTYYIAAIIALLAVGLALRFLPQEPTRESINNP